ncbi:bifunctional phosphoribosylaminoimidazolecarboxamide formyltransferase/IMP cyclohydrolase [Candidatus Margulisiibacteriota bacterium]
MRALLSVSDKKGIVEFAYNLVKLGVEIISTGGTYKVLKENNIKVTPIEKVTDFPEMLDGRVKTLNPKIHGGLLAVRDNAEHLKTCKKYNIPLIDLVAVNLYPFEKTISKKKVSLTEAIENIDIGGPTMIRSASKNYESVGVIVNPDKYPEIIKELKKNKGELSLKTKQLLALEAFQHTARYDTIISDFLNNRFKKGKSSTFPSTMAPIFEKVSDLRYGENPHQQAAFYKASHEKGLPETIQLHGKELSYNNYIDLDAAWSIAKSYALPVAAVIKHTNPCGAAIGDNIYEAYKKAHAADPISAFGSIVGLNKNVNIEVAEEIAKTFIEAVIAPSFDEEALKILTRKPSIRLIAAKEFFQADPIVKYRNIRGGFLVQSFNTSILSKEHVRAVTKIKPTEKELNDLIFSFNLIKHIKSNAILVAKDGQTVGIGAGQMSRIDAVKIALEKAGKKAEGAVVASDAFFPFKDSIEMMAKYKIKGVIQPGGSKRDQESIDSANKHQMAMVFTDIRYFTH